MAHSYWKRRAQQNKFAVQPLVAISKGWKYCACYRDMAEEDNRVYQEWLYRQTGKTFRLLPTRVIYSPKTQEEHAAGNFYYDVLNQLRANPINDSTGKRMDFCRWDRVYTLAAAGSVGLKNMAGRLAWNCPVDAGYPPAGHETLFPNLPGTAGGPSGWSAEVLTGHPAEGITDEASRVREGNKIRGATIHELMHCFGLGHPDDKVYGNAAWLSPMGGYWFFPEGDAAGNPCALLPHEIEQLRASPFFK